MTSEVIDKLPWAFWTARRHSSPEGRAVGHNPPEAQQLLGGITALGRMGTPAEVADVVAFLAGPDGRWMTGQNLRASGGMLV
ncbi:hypothetical protein GCM10009804_62480 [Kribbella hippodromi]|uniref:SDR family oxidoreductase n=1 Tax=Kribbella hippodromi TaxID=434347 RepID=A0ABP4Q343_9ACTN